MKWQQKILNHNFFEDDNEFSFYWAGFLAADGTINDKNRLSVHLKHSDILHLKKLKRAINSYHKITKGKRKNNTEYCRFSCTSKNISNDLKRFNIVPRKTHIYSVPENVINSPFIKHFIRGYLDGDGCINKNNKQWKISFRGTYNTLNSIANILNKKTKINIPKFQNDGSYKIEYSGNLNAGKICNFLYKNNQISLNRKNKLAQQIIKQHQILLKNKENFNKKISKENLTILYIKYKSSRKIAKKLNLGKSTILRYLHKYNIL